MLAKNHLNQKGRRKCFDLGIGYRKQRRDQLKKALLAAILEYLFLMTVGFFVGIIFRPDSLPCFMGFLSIVFGGAALGFGVFSYTHWRKYEYHSAYEKPQGEEIKLSEFDERLDWGLIFAVPFLVLNILIGGLTCGTQL